MMLSIAMIVKNEEKNLERTLIPLKELQKYIDTEIVIIDTGSTDSTVDIAKKYTDKVYYHPWNDDFAAMRNVSISYCTGDWILVVDADEELYDIKELANLIDSKVLSEHNGAFIRIINFDKDIKNTINNGHISPLLRLFRKGTIKYEGRVHEQPRYKNSLASTNIRFIHYGYNNSDYELIEYKFERNLFLLQKELKNKPDSVYIHYQIAASYHIHKDLREALKYIKISYDKGKNNIGEYIYVIDKYCSILYSMKEYELLLDKANEAIQHHNNFIDFYFYLGEAYYNLKQYNNAINAYKKYLICYDELKNNRVAINSTLSVVTKAYRDNVIYNLSICNYKCKFYDEALDLILKISDTDLVKNKIYSVLKIIAEGSLWNKFYLVNDFIDKYNYEIVLTYVHNDILLEDLNKLNRYKFCDSLRQIISIVTYFKNNRNINKEILDEIKKITDNNKMLYTIYLYYALKFDINEINYFSTFGKCELENTLVNLCYSYYDFNGELLRGIYKISDSTLENVIIRIIMEKALILSNKLARNERKELFLKYISEKYYSIIKIYNIKEIKDNIWFIPPEDRFVIELKETLSNKYIDSLNYIKMLKNNLNIDKSYVDYIKLLIEEDNEFINNNDIKAFVPNLVSGVQALISREKYQEAYNTIEEGLSLVKFDFDLMVLRYKLLLKFNYEEEAGKCLRDIILYGDSEKVIELINNL